MLKQSDQSVSTHNFKLKNNFCGTLRRSNMLISKRHNFIFVHIYKNAGTSIKFALKPFAATKWEIGASRLLRKVGISATFDPQPLPGHTDASTIIDFLGEDVFKSFFSFAIVRNPWDWQVSLYKFMLKNTSHYQHEFVKSLSGFDDYIRWRCEKEIRLQKDFIYSKEGELLVKFVGRFKSLEADFQKICSEIGISASLPSLNVSNTQPYQKFYTSETKELVTKAFEADISKFNYCF